MVLRDQSLESAHGHDLLKARSGSLAMTVALMRRLPADELGLSGRHQERQRKVEQGYPKAEVKS